MYTDNILSSFSRVTESLGTIDSLSPRAKHGKLESQFQLFTSPDPDIDFSESLQAYNL